MAVVRFVVAGQCDGVVCHQCADQVGIDLISVRHDLV